MTSPSPEPNASGTAVVFALASTSLFASQRRKVHTDDRLVEELQRDPAVHLVVAEPYRSAPIKAIRAVAEARRTRLEQETTVYQPVRARRTEHTRIGAAERAAQRWSHGLQRHVAARGMTAPHVVLGCPFYAGLVELPWARSVVFYAIDDWANGEPMAPWHNLIEHNYSEIRRKGRAMLSVAPSMLERVGTPGLSRLLPNAVDTELWLTDVAPSVLLADFPAPIAVYVGTLDGRIDKEQLSAISTAIGRGTIVLVGHETNDRTRAAARALDNVHFAGPVSPEHVPAMLAAADIALLPHVDDAATRGMSPLKIYEYLAAGLPVVATDLEPVRGMGERVLLCQTPIEFAAATRRALAIGRSTKSERDLFVAQHSWVQRKSELLAFCTAVENER